MSGFSFYKNEDCITSFYYRKASARKANAQTHNLILPVPGDTNDPECRLSRPSTSLLPVTRTSVLHCAQQQVTLMEDHLIVLTVRKE